MIQNIRLAKANMTRIDGYFYSFDRDTDAMIQKTDDGTLAFAYPLDTPISNNIVSLDFDGESFWTLEHIDDGDAAAGFRIRRWIISNFVMSLQQTFSFATNAVDTFESNAMAVERYESTLSNNSPASTSTIFVANYSATPLSLITPGVKMFLGPNSLGQTERVTVASRIGGTVTLSAPLTHGYSSGNSVIFSKNLWVFNEHYLKTEDVGGLYKISGLDGSILSRTQGGAYATVNAAGFVELSSFTGSLSSFNKPYLIFIRTNNLLFTNTNDSNLTTELSAVQNNLKANTVSVITVFDLATEGNTIFRLQNEFNINGVDSSESTFNYQLATFEPFPTAIALVADPAIIPADSGGSTSTITATVTDQYGLAFVTSPAATIQFTTTGGGGSLNNTNPIALDSNGQATVIYISGNTAGLVTITATVTI